ncbi:MAG: DHHA1 domain-containing protein, partial [Bradymonadaceae bacterium]
FEAVVDRRHREQTAANHTATHLLHAALRDEVADSIFQAGSLVAPDKLRFDFSYGQPLSDDQVQRIEARVNRLIRERLPVVCHTNVARERAVDEMGAMAIFGEKYGDTVRVVQVPGESVELCGGIHVGNTGDISLFRVTSESGVAAGIRRIEAVSEQGAYATFLEDRQRLKEVSRVLKSDTTNIIDRAKALVEERTELERQVDSLSQKLAHSGSSKLAENAVDIQGIKVIADLVKVDTRDQLLAYADGLREKLGESEGAVLLGAEIDEKAALVCVVTDAAVKGRGLKAGRLINVVSSHVEGRGGGRPTLAQAGGTNPAGLSQAVAAFQAAVEEAL